LRRLRAVCLLLILIAAGTAGASEAPVRGYIRGQSYQYILFGNYPTLADGTEQPVLWRILSVDGAVALILTEQVIDAQQVLFVSDPQIILDHSYRRIGGYLETDLHPWMNGEMLNTLFSADEKALLVSEERGKLFCLTTEEFCTPAYGFSASLWSEQKSRQCSATGYAKARGVYVDSTGTTCYWVGSIKNPEDYKMQIVGFNGHMSFGAYTRVNVGLRPAARLNLGLIALGSGTGTKKDPYMVSAAAGI
jgi:hypothetical protein